MLASSFLDTAIGIIFVFLLLSIIATTVNEIILSFVNMRGRMLLSGLKTLLNDPNAQGLVKEVYNHGQIFGLFKGNFNPSTTWKQEFKSWRHEFSLKTDDPGDAAPPSQRHLPSYIPSGSFATAFLGVLVSQASQGARDALEAAKKAAADARTAAQTANLQANDIAARIDKQLFEKDAARAAAFAAQGAAEVAQLAVNGALFAVLRDAATNLAKQNDKVGKPLVAILETVNNDVHKLEANIETWYNSGMDRVSGWYKYHTQWVLFWIGLVLAVGLNANTVDLVKQISTNDTLRQSIVAAAQNYKPSDADAQTVAQNPAGNDAGLSQKTGDQSAAAGVQQAAPATTNPSGIPASAETNKFKDVATKISAIKDLGLPLGWGNTKLGWSAAIGWPLTAVAISLGAPFWFDLLNKFMIVRSTVKPHEKSQEEGSKDKQP